MHVYPLTDFFAENLRAFAEPLKAPHVPQFKKRYDKWGSFNNYCIFDVSKY